MEPRLVSRVAVVAYNTCTTRNRQNVFSALLRVAAMAEMITNLLQAQTRSDEMTGTRVPKTMRTTKWYLNAQGLDAAADNVVHGARRERSEWGSERRRGRGSSIQGKTFRDRVGKLPWAAGTAYNLQRRPAAQPGRVGSETGAPV
jgi:hypothetical protein